MFKNYLKIALRNILRQKGYSFINMTGLALGIASCIILFLYISYELGFNTYHEKVNDIYRLCVHVQIGSTDIKGSASNALCAGMLKEKYPEVKDAVRFGGKPSVNGIYNGKEYRINRLRYVDASVFNIFSFPIVKGNPNFALLDPFTIVLTETTAKNIFNDEDPLGKILRFANGESFTVTGIMKDFPGKSTMNYDGFCSFKSLYTEEPLSPILTEMTSFNFTTFLLLDDGVNYKNFETKISKFLHEQAGEDLAAKGAKETLFLQPFRDIYLRPIDVPIGPIHYVYIFTAIAIFILSIACVNFMNLSTARSTKRSLEVGLRKTLGSSRKSLILQFLGESILFSFLGLLIAIGIVSLVLPEISSITNRKLGWDLNNNVWLLPGLFFFTLIVGVLAGSYPAFILSGFSPVNVLKGQTKTNSFASNLRRFLVVFQFVISITLIIGTGIIINQLNFLKERDPGFNKEHVLAIPIFDDKARSSKDILKEKLQKSPGVLNVALSSTVPTWGCPSNDKIPEGFTKETTQLMDEIAVDENYLQTMGMELIAGRNFSKEFGTDARSSVIINETAVKTFGWSEPIGKKIQTSDAYNIRKGGLMEMTVIGVVKDFNQREVTEKIKPLFIANFNDFPFRYNQLQVLTVRINPKNIKTTIAGLENRWNEVISHRPFEYYFMDEEFDAQFGSIENSRKIFSYFTFLAIIIACLGLFGLTSLTTQQRTKEIGIRKVLGSSNKKIVYLLSKELIILILLAIAIAWPITYLIFNGWLQDFPYRADIKLITFISYSILVIVISMITITFQAVKASLANPINSIRNE